MRILLADDQPKVLFALGILLKRRPEVVIVGEAKNADELISQLNSDCPDLVIIDWMLPGLTGVGSISGIRNVCPELQIIALSGRPELGRSALEAGADAFVSKIEPPEILLSTLAECQGQFDAVNKQTEAVEAQADAD